MLGDNSVWLLMTAGKLHVVDQQSGKPSKPVVKAPRPVVAIAKDRQGRITIADTAHQISQYDKPTNSWHPIATYSGKLAGMVFTSQNQCLLVTDKGIVDPTDQRTYFPDSTYSGNTGNWLRQKRWFTLPAYFLDSHDRLWLGLDYGEWGGDVFTFDTQSRSFIQLKTDSVRMESNPVFGFCEDGQNVYMSGGVTHMILTHGSITKINNMATNLILESNDKEVPQKVTLTGSDGKQKTETWITWTGGHRIGPSAYNPVDKCLYFYSQYGIFKGRTNTDLSDIKRWKTVIKPKLRWRDGQPYAAGPAMNVSRMLFTTDGKLYFLAGDEGLGIYAGKTLRFLK